MAARKRSRFVCNACGHEETKWLGRCPACGNWNTFEESDAAAAVTASAHRPASATTADALLLDRIRTQESLRIRTGLTEFDRVLGGGASLGSSTLIGGEPGIGKSTLLLQAAGSTSDTFTTLYVTGEEAAGQLKQRAARLGVRGEKLHILANANLAAVLRNIEKIKPDIIVIDSVQTLYSDEAASMPGSPTQLRYCTFEIADWARSNSAVCFFVAHVTKDGAIAGPKVMEHMVDTVLLFEEAEGSTRILRATKNRFGATDEIGLFTMVQSGLREVSDPSALFLVRRDGPQPPGVVIAPVYEGSRILLVEIQALTVPAKGGVSRVFSDRIESARVSRVAAVLEKHAGLGLNDQDLYVNVAGGMRISEVGVDLPLAIALYSAATGTPAQANTAVTGELSLAGEIRPVTGLERRLRSVLEYGLSGLVGPHDFSPGESGKATDLSALNATGSILAALKAVFSTPPRTDRPTGAK